MVSITPPAYLCVHTCPITRLLDVFWRMPMESMWKLVGRGVSKSAKEGSVHIRLIDSYRGRSTMSLTHVFLYPGSMYFILGKSSWWQNAESLSERKIAEFGGFVGPIWTG